MDEFKDDQTTESDTECSDDGLDKSAQKSRGPKKLKTSRKIGDDSSTSPQHNESDHENAVLKKEDSLKSSAVDSSPSQQGKKKPGPKRSKSLQERAEQEQPETAEERTELPEEGSAKDSENKRPGPKQSKIDQGSSGERHGEGSSASPQRESVQKRPGPKQKTSAQVHEKQQREGTASPHGEDGQKKSGPKQKTSIQELEKQQLEGTASPQGEDGQNKSGPKQKPSTQEKQRNASPASQKEEDAPRKAGPQQKPSTQEKQRGESPASQKEEDAPRKAGPQQKPSAQEKQRGESPASQKGENGPKRPGPKQKTIIQQCKTKPESPVAQRRDSVQENGQRKPGPKQRKVGPEKTGEKQSENANESAELPEGEGQEYQAAASAILEHLNKEFEDKIGQIADYTEEIANLKQAVTKANKENDELKKKLKSQELENTDVRTKLKDKEIENKDVKMKLRHKELEIETMKTKVKEPAKEAGGKNLQAVASALEEVFTRLGNEIQGGRKQLSDLLRRDDSSSIEDLAPNKKRKLETNDAEDREGNRKLKRENDDMKEKIRDLERELKKENQDWKNKYDRIVAKLKDKETEMVKVKEEDQKGSNRKIKEEHASFMKEIIVVKNSNDELKDKLREKEREVRKLKEDLKNSANVRVKVEPAEEDPKGHRKPKEAPAKMTNREWREFNRLKEENESLVKEILQTKSKYDDIVGKLKERELELTLLKVNTMEEEQAGMPSKFIRLQQEKASLVEQIIQAKNESDEIKSILRDRELEISKLNEHIADAKLSSNPHEFTKMRRENAKLVKDLIIAKNQIDEYETMLKDKDLELIILNEGLQNLGHQPHEEEQEELQQRNFSLQKEVGIMKNVIENLKSKLKDQELEIVSLNEELTNAGHEPFVQDRNETRQLKIEIEALQQDNNASKTMWKNMTDELKAKLKKKDAELADLKKELGKQSLHPEDRKDLRRLKDKVVTLEKEIAKKKNENDLLRKNLDDRELELIKLKEDAKYMEHQPLAEDPKGYRQSKDESHLVNEIVRTKNENDSLKDKLKNKQIALVKLNDELKSLKQKDDRKLREENASLLKEVKAARSEIDEVKMQLKTKEVHIIQLNEKIERLSRGTSGHVKIEPTEEVVDIIL